MLSKRFTLTPQLLGTCFMVLGFLGLAWNVGWMVWGPSTLPAEAAPKQQGVKRTVSCTVLMVFDGDTLACDLNHNGKMDKPKEHIRLIGVDAAEMHYSKKNMTGKDEPFALAAKQFLETQTLNKPLYLEADIEKRDRYKRTLAYVYTTPTGGESLNQQLLKKGLATLFFIPPNTRHQTLFQTAQTQARQKHLGLWSALTPSKKGATP